MNISIQQVKPFSEPKTVCGIVACYQKAFGGEPWNEGYVCPVCGKTFPFREAGKSCPACIADGKSVVLVEYWPTSKVTSDFYCEMKKPDARCLVAKDGDRVVGFIWGYRIVADSHIDDYLEAPGLSRLVSGEFFYLDDVAVLPEYQRQGIGKKLVLHMFGIKRQGNVLLRTLDQSRMFRIARDIGGKTVLGITRNRVIMTISL